MGLRQIDTRTWTSRLIGAEAQRIWFGNHTLFADTWPGLAAFDLQGRVRFEVFQPNYVETVQSFGSNAFVTFTPTKTEYAVVSVDKGTVTAMVKRPMPLILAP